MKKSSVAALFASVAILAVAGSSFAAEVGATVGGAANAAAGATSPAGSAGANATGGANATVGATTSPGSATASGSTSVAATIDAKVPFGDIKVDTKATSEAQIKAFIGTLSPQQVTDLGNRCNAMLADQPRYGADDVKYCESFAKMKM